MLRGGVTGKGKVLVWTHASKVVHAESEESRLCETIHQELRIARHSPDVWEIQHYISVGLLRRRDVCWYIEDGVHFAAWGALVDRAEPAARSWGLGQVLFITGSSHVVSVVLFEIIEMTGDSALSKFRTCMGWISVNAYRWVG